MNNTLAVVFPDAVTDVLTNVLTNPFTEAKPFLQKLTSQTAYTYQTGYHYISRYIYPYLYKNITLPRVSPDYYTNQTIDPTTILPNIPSKETVVVGLWEIGASVHPNYYALALIFACLSIFVYIKIRYPFWNTQPVLHTYDYWRKIGLSTPGIIQKYPHKTRFYDTTKQIQTREYSKISSEEIKQIAIFLNANYIPTDKLLSTITEKTLANYCNGHNAPTYISIHRELDKTITGLCISRLSNLYLYNTIVNTDPNTLVEIDGYKDKDNKPNKIETYLLDFVAIKRKAETRTAEKLFQTHEYNIRILNPKIHTSIFKKEGELCECVVPFMEYTNRTFYMRNMNVNPLPPDFIISRVAKENIDTLHDIYHLLTNPEPEMKQMMGGCILPELGHIQSLLVSRQLYLFCLKKGGYIYGVYFLRDSNIHYETIDGKTLELVASFQNTTVADVFMVGFAHSLRQILRENPDFKILNIPDIGHNATILGKWLEYNHTILETHCALYLYNYWLSNMPIEKSKMFVLS
jgi:hypothetical protein